MRRLDILLVGTSPAIGAFARLLDEHGHGTTMADSAQALRRQLSAATELVVDDGSLTLASGDWQALGSTPLLRLRLGAASVKPCRTWKPCAGAAVPLPSA